jgi:hypothetical protein
MAGVFYYACFWDNTQKLFQSKTEKFKMNIVMCSRYTTIDRLSSIDTDTRIRQFHKKHDTPIRFTIFNKINNNAN